MHRTLLAVWLCILCLQSASAQVTLKPAFQEGSRFTIQEISNSQQTLSIAGMDVVTKTETIGTIVSIVGKRNAAGQLEVTKRNKSLQVSIATQGMEYFFDSANPNKRGNSALEIFRDVHKLSTRMTSIVVYDKDLQVREVKINDNLLNGLPAAARNLAKDQFAPQTLATAAQQEFACLPEKPVNAGDSWTRPETLTLDSGQALVFEVHYRYDGTIDKNNMTLDKITRRPLKVKLTLADDAPLPFKLKESNLKPENSSVLLFDRRRGRFVQRKESVRIAGVITFIANGNDLPAKLDLVINSETTEMP
ncbi:MAG: hypothetical protein VX346_12190 [Planctomycetota bacterium]|nr:hypothetical protein [Planctomycetota bacterium]